MSRHKTGRAVIYVPVQNCIIVATPKVAQTTIRFTIGEHEQCPKQDVALYDHVIALIRDPIERFESAYRYFKQMDSFPLCWVDSEQRMESPKPETIEIFTNLVLDGGLWDKHWLPQTEIWGVEPTDILPFEALSTVLASFGYGPRRENASGVPKTGVQYRLPELLEFYAADVEARAKAVDEWTNNVTSFQLRTGNSRKVSRGTR